MRGFYTKLFSLKKDIQHWNKNIFENIFSTLKHAEEQLNRTESTWDASPTEETREAFYKAKANYLLASNYELQYLKQKARVKWLQEGNANTRYFHSLVKGKRSQLCIRQIRNSHGTLLTNPDDIMTAAVAFYMDLFTRAPMNTHSAILSHIPHLISDADNLMLT